MRIQYRACFLSAGIALFSCQWCQGQSLSIGVKGGGRLIDDIVTSHNSATSESKRYKLGPMLEVDFPLGLSVEFDALYQRQGYRSAYGSLLGSTNSRVRANAWELPVLIKYRLPRPFHRPFVEVGIVPRVMSGAVADQNGYTIDIQTGAVTYGQSRGSAIWPNTVGATFGGGMRFALRSLALAPEVRYTRWNDTALNQYGSYGYEFHSSQSQVDVQIGISWRLR